MGQSVWMWWWKTASRMRRIICWVGAMLGMEITPPVRRDGALRAPERIARSELVAQARLDGLNGQRWKCETVYSVIKRKFGDTVRSRTTRLHFREVFVKGLIYNFHVLCFFVLSDSVTEQLFTLKKSRHWMSDGIFSYC